MPEKKIIESSSELAEPDHDDRAQEYPDDVEVEAEEKDASDDEEEDG